MCEINLTANGLSLLVLFNLRKGSLKSLFLSYIVDILSFVITMAEAVNSTEGISEDDFNSFVESILTELMQAPHNIRDDHGMLRRYVAFLLSTFLKQNERFRVSERKSRSFRTVMKEELFNAYTTLKDSYGTDDAKKIVNIIMRRIYIKFDSKEEVYFSSESDINQMGPLAESTSRDIFSQFLDDDHFGSG